MKKLCSVLLFISLPTIANAYEVFFNATEPYLTKDGNSVVFDGVRVDGFGFSPEADALKLKFTYDQDSYGFMLDQGSTVVYEDIGIFHMHHIWKDVEKTEINYISPYISLPEPPADDSDIVAETPECCISGEQFKFTVPAGETFTADLDLEKGHVLSWFILSPTQDFTLKLIGANTEFEVSGKRKETVLTKPVKIFLDGSYQLTVSGADAEKDFSFKMMLSNANNTISAPAVHKDVLKVRIAKNTWEYSKFQVTLNADDTLELPATGSGVKLLLVDKMSQTIASATGNDVLMLTATKPSTYYLLVFNTTTDEAGNYAGRISIQAPEPVKETPTPKPSSKPKDDSVPADAATTN